MTNESNVRGSTRIKLGSVVSKELGVNLDLRVLNPDAQDVEVDIGERPFELGVGCHDVLVRGFERNECCAESRRLRAVGFFDEPT